MTKLTDSLSNAWPLVKNEEGKEANFIGKASPYVWSFIGKPLPNVGNIRNFLSYLTCKLGTSGKTINNVAGLGDSMTVMFLFELKEKVEQY